MLKIGDRVRIRGQSRSHRVRGLAGGLVLLEGSYRVPVGQLVLTARKADRPRGRSAA